MKCVGVPTGSQASADNLTPDKPISRALGKDGAIVETADLALVLGRVLTCPPDSSPTPDGNCEISKVCPDGGSLDGNGTCLSDNLQPVRQNTPCPDGGRYVKVRDVANSSTGLEEGRCVLFVARTTPTLRTLVIR